jgi:hypothetical protein
MTGGCNSQLQRSFELIKQAHALLDRGDELDDFEDSAWELVLELVALVNEFREIYPAKTFGVWTDCAPVRGARRLTLQAGMARKRESLRRGKRNPHATPAH